MTLGDFLASQAGDPWNCSTMPADWCMTLGHPDFAAAWRHVVETEACEAAPGDDGLVTLWDRGIGDALPLVAPPYEAGDVGVIAAHGLEAGAIYTGDKWAVRTARGISCARLPDSAIAAAWRP